MKRTVSIILALCVLTLIFTGCTKKAGTVEYNLKTLSSDLQKSGAFSDILGEIDQKSVSTLYGVASADVSDCVVLCSTGATTEEIGLFKCADADAAARVLKAAKARIDSQKEAYQSYAPAEIPKLGDAIVRQDGVYVFYIVSADTAKAQAVLDKQGK